MFEQHRQHGQALGLECPQPPEVLAYLRQLPKDTVYSRLLAARHSGHLLVQPRCGVGDHAKMRGLITGLEELAAPDVATLTIDAHTRLKRFDVAARVMRQEPQQLNGYPLVAHGWRRGRELNEAVRAPVQVRHGSPDPRMLFEVALASGFTAFEGGGIGYNIPYCKDVRLEDSLQWWREVDARCGELARLGVIVDREFFGTLTAVLMPPAIQLATAMLEAILAHQSGVRSLSVAVCQTGHIIQDIAMLRAIPRLAQRYLPQAADDVFPVFHQFMGAFPMQRQDSDALILRGAMVAKAGGAVKTINKTHQEAFGVPTLDANVSGILLSKAANSWILDLIDVSGDRVEQELDWLVEDVDALLSPVLQGADLVSSICDAFAKGQLDVPFSASRYALAQVVPMRAPDGAIRIFDFGKLPLPQHLRRRHLNALGSVHDDDVFQRLESDILWFCRKSTNDQTNDVAPDDALPSHAAGRRIEQLTGSA
jgi:methylaspartate mutase epsilon subunit